MQNFFTYSQSHADQISDNFCQLLFDTFGNGISSAKTIQQLSVLKQISFPA